VFGLVRVFRFVFGGVSVLFVLCSGTVRGVFGLCSGPGILGGFCFVNGVVGCEWAVVIETYEVC